MAINRHNYDSNFSFIMKFFTLGSDCHKTGWAVLSAGCRTERAGQEKSNDQVYYK